MHNGKRAILDQNFGKSPKYELIFPIYPNFKAFPTKNLRAFWEFQNMFQCIYA